VGIKHHVQLSMTAGLGPVLIRRLIATLGDAERACAASVRDLQQVEGIGSHRASTIYPALQQAAAQVEGELQRATDAGAYVICFDDHDYPELLRTIPDPPAVLYVKGAIEARDLNAVGIVGSRRCSIYGREQAERFGALLAGAGFTVISGGARGIDTAAHHGALLTGIGRTIAVLGSGLDVPYPAENANLFDQIATRGAVLSEYPMGTPPLPDNFPRRNRIVSGMSRGILVVEADVRSGALITARQAADDHNRPVFAVPGRLDNAMSAGPHKLIRDGAVLVTCLEDILESLEPFPQDVYDDDAPEGDDEPGDAPDIDGVLGDLPGVPDAPETAAGKQTPSALLLTERQTKIVDALDDSGTSIDQIMDRAGLAAHEILQELTLLSLRGVIKRVDGQSYARRS